MFKTKLKLGIDIGGSKINIVVWDGEKIIERWKTEKPEPAKLKQGISYFNVSKIGIGVPGIVDFKTGKILKCSNLPSFNGLNLKKILKAEVRLDNDAKCFLRAEAKLGAGRNYKNILAVVMGTGVGGAVLINEKLKMKNKKFREQSIYRGATGGAGEVGHIIIDEGKTWERLYQETKDNPVLQRKVNAMGLANLINVLDPEIIILGGDGARLPERELMEEYIVSPLSKETKIVLGKLGKDAVAVGAALLFD